MPLKNIIVHVPQLNNQKLSMSTNQIEDIVSQIKKLPTLPTVANKTISVVVSVKHHHQKVEDRNRSDFAQDLIADIVRLSDVICKCECIGYNGDTVETELTDDLWERLSLNAGAIEKIIAASKEELAKASILMDVA